MKLLLGSFLLAGIVAAAFASRRPKLVLLFAWVVSLTYNRQYFSFEALVGNNSGQGPYWIVADVFFAALLAGWMYETCIQKRAQRPRGDRVYLMFLPFAAIGLLAGLGAERPDWSLYEIVRSVKILMILLYARYNIGRAEWWTCVAAMGCAAVLQSTLGVLEVTMQRSGVLGILGLGGSASGMPEQFSPERFYGWWRATGTMNHPPNLACYLLLTLPLPVALSLAAESRRLRAIAAGAALVAVVGLAFTLSRWPWVLAIVQVALLLTMLTALGLLSIRRGIGVTLVGSLAAAIVLLPFTGFIVDRINRDLDRSLEFRQNENRVALAMTADHPFFGVGPNNYKLYLSKYGSEMTWALDSEDLAVRLMRVRFIAAPQNGFLLTLAETGVFGLAAFVMFLVTVVLVGARGVLRSRGTQQAVMAGLLVGIAGVVAQQLVDYSLWTDPLLYTFALVTALLAAPSPPTVTGGKRGCRV